MSSFCRYSKLLKYRNAKCVCVSSPLLSSIPACSSFTAATNLQARFASSIDLAEAERKSQILLDAIEYMVQDPEDVKTRVEVLDESGESIGIMNLAEAKIVAKKKYLELIPDLRSTTKTKPKDGKEDILRYKLVTMEEYRNLRVKKRDASIKERSIRVKWSAESPDVEQKCKLINKWIKKGQQVKLMWIAPNRPGIAYQDYLGANHKRLLENLTDCDVKSVDGRDPPLNFVVLPKKS